MSVAGKSYWGPGRLPPSFDFGPGAASLMIIRHSARIPVITAADAFTAHLTDEGRAMACAYGAELGSKVHFRAAMASPVARCMETAQQILTGAMNGSAHTVPVKPLTALHFEQRQTGIPGLEKVYLNDPGFLELVAHPESREYALMRQSLLDSLPFCSEPGATHLAVTHDVVVTFLRTSLLGLPNATLSDFPGFLEGLILVRRDNQISLI